MELPGRALATGAAWGLVSEWRGLEYDLQVSPLGYTPQKKRLTLDGPVAGVDFELEVTAGRVLVLDAVGAAQKSEPAPLARPARWRILAALLVAVVLGWPRSGLHLTAWWHRPAPPPPG